MSGSTCSFFFILFFSVFLFCLSCCFCSRVFCRASTLSSLLTASRSSLLILFSSWLKTEILQPLFSTYLTQHNISICIITVGSKCLRPLGKILLHFFFIISYISSITSEKLDWKINMNLEISLYLVFPPFCFNDNNTQAGMNSICLCKTWKGKGPNTEPCGTP